MVTGVGNTSPVVVCVEVSLKKPLTEDPLLVSHLLSNLCSRLSTSFIFLHSILASFCLESAMETSVKSVFKVYISYFMVMIYLHMFYCYSELNHRYLLLSPLTILRSCSCFVISKHFLLYFIVLLLHNSNILPLSLYFLHMFCLDTASLWIWCLYLLRLQRIFSFISPAAHFPTPTEPTCPLSCHLLTLLS